MDDVHHGKNGGAKYAYRHVPRCPVQGIVRLTDDPERVTCPECLDMIGKDDQ